MSDPQKRKEKLPEIDELTRTFLACSKTLERQHRKAMKGIAGLASALDRILPPPDKKGKPFKNARPPSWKCLNHGFQERKSLAEA